MQKSQESRTFAESLTREYRMFVLLAEILVSIVFLSGCSSGSKNSYSPEMLHAESKPQVRTKIFVGTNMNLVMKSLLNTLHEEGYVVRNVNTELGFITATREVDIEKETDKYWSGIRSGHEARWAKERVIEATLNLSDQDSQICVKTSFLLKDLDNNGALWGLRQLDDENFYRRFFSHVDQELYILQHKKG